MTTSQSDTAPRRYGPDGLPDRRRPGRREYENAHLIALLRGQAVPDASDLAFPSGRSGPEPRAALWLVLLGTVLFWTGIGMAIAVF